MHWSSADQQSLAGKFGYQLLSFAVQIGNGDSLKLTVRSVGRANFSERVSTLSRSHSRGCPATVQPRPCLRFLVSIWRQSAPTVPVWPVMPSHTSFVFKYKGDLSFHGMEEVTGSIPVRSTKLSNDLDCRMLQCLIPCGGK